MPNDYDPDDLLRTVRFLLGRMSFQDQRNALDHLDYVLGDVTDNPINGSPLDRQLRAIRTVIIQNR